jgi:hypothetical protein
MEWNRTTGWVMKDSNFRGYDINCWKIKEKIWKICNCKRAIEV